MIVDVVRACGSSPNQLTEQPGRPNADRPECGTPRPAAPLTRLTAPTAGPAMFHRPQAPAPANQEVATLSQYGSATRNAENSLPVRSPGAHLHPLLRRPPLADRGGAQDSR